MRHPYRSIRLSTRLLAVTVLLTSAFVLGCATTQPEPAPIPRQGDITANVTSDPPGIAVAFRGEEVGSAPLEITLESLAAAAEVSAVPQEPPLVERRIRILAADRVEIRLRLGGQPSDLVRALGLSQVTIFDYGENITFDFDRAELKPDFRSILEHQAALLTQQFRDIDVYICGHTDSTGPADYNQLLSLRRAQAVADFLVTRGVDPARLKVQGFGPDYPVASNAERPGRAQNRRTEIILPG